MPPPRVLAEFERIADGLGREDYEMHLHLAHAVAAWRFGELNRDERQRLRQLRERIAGRLALYRQLQPAGVG